MKDGSDPAFSRGDRDIGPVHVGIIMDGNGRWAKRRRRPRLEGHRAGLKSIRRVLQGRTTLLITHRLS